MPDYVALDILPAEHPRTLVVKTATASGENSLTSAFANKLPLFDAVNRSGGLARLAGLEREGGVTGVFPIGGSPLDDLPRGAGALSALAFQSQNDAQPFAATIVTLAANVDVDGLLDDLNDDTQVSYATRVPARYIAVAAPSAQFNPSAAMRSPAQSELTWNLQRIRFPQIQRPGIDDAHTVRVGVLDTGVDNTHPALVAVLDSYITGNSGTIAISGQDIVGHGTHVSGTIASQLEPSIGTRGICDARIKVWKIFDDEPDYIASGGIYWYLVDPVLYRSALAACIGEVDVLNLSIGGRNKPDQQEEALFRLLDQHGVVVVAAMGNERAAGSPTSYPAAIPGVIAVGATTPSDSVAAFSNAGNHITVAAPGSGIWSTLPTYPGQIGYRVNRVNGQPFKGTPFPRDENYAAMDGTSMAAPHVTAAAALVLANSPHTRTPQEVHDLLMVTATRLPAMGNARWTPDLGAGLLNLDRLMFAAQRL